MPLVPHVTNVARFLSYIAMWLVLACTAGSAAPTFPVLTGRVVDEGGILSKATEDQLTAVSEELEKKTGSQLVIVTLKSLQGYAVEDYGYQLGRAWGIGQQGKNTGAILIVAANERAVRIEVGYGLEDRLTDAASRSVIESIILPSFRRGDYDAGVREGVAAIAALIAGSAIAPQPGIEPKNQGIPFEFILAILFFVFIGGRGIFWPFLFLGGRNFRGGRSGGFYSGSSRGFSGGGGSFGGGGASGRW